MVGKSNRTKEEKTRIVMEALSNTASITEICRRHNVGSSAFYAWRDAFIAAGTAALEPEYCSIFHGPEACPVSHNIPLTALRTHRIREAYEIGSLS